MIGEAVVLELRPARLPSRALALALDAVIVGVLLALILTAVALVGADFDDALSAAVSIAVLVGLVAGYPLLWETLTRGRSPGKYALGLRVVRDDGGPIRFRHALTRALAGLLLDFGVLSGGTGVVAVLVSISSARGKRVGDLLAGTVVLRERVPRAAARTPDLPPVHPGLAAWATGLELSRVPDDLALAARQFLVRAPQLDAGVRASMADRLATDVAGRVAPPPPPGVPAEAYLAAVLGERRRRETARLERARPGASPPAPPPASSSASPPASPPAPTPGRPAPGAWSTPDAPATPAVPAPSSDAGFAPPG